MTAPAIEVWFELASPYSYLGVSRVEDVARAAGVPIAWRPFLLGPIFQKQGWSDSPFNLYPAKGRYMWRDMERLAARYALAFRRPSVFPRSGVLAARVALVAADEGWCGPFARAAFAASFAHDRDIASRDVLAEIVADLGHDADATLARAESAANKPRLRAQTARAEELGIFGAPTFAVDGEIFWGDDRLEQAVAWALAPEGSRLHRP